MERKFDHKRLLIADDSRAVRVYLENVMSQLEIPFEMFENGQELIEFLEKQPDDSGISAVITDLEMPIASGHTVIKFIRNDARFSQLVIGVHSSMTAENNERDVRRLGADFLLEKLIQTT